jgi:LmbE family N-acetylglucosaminyl deacetylase
MPSKWTAVDALIRALGAVRFATDAADAPHERKAAVDTAIRNAAEAINLTIGSPQSREGLSAADNAVQTARRALAAMVVELPRYARAAAAVAEPEEDRPDADGPIFGIIRERAAATAGVSPRTLLLAGHPDDEIACAGALLLRLDDVVIVLLTDGAPRDDWFHLHAGVTSRAAYADLRRHELQSALAVAGIGASRLVSLGAVDQEAMDELPRLTRDLCHLLRAWRPAVVLTHPYEGGHPDHDAAAFVAQSAVQLAAADEPPVIVEMGSYHDAGSGLECGVFLPDADVPEAALVLTPEERSHKSSMLECFASQREVLARFAVEEERYRRSPRYDFRAPPHPGPLHYERWGWRATGEAFRARADHALRTLGIDEAPRA